MNSTQNGVMKVCLALLLEELCLQWPEISLFPKVEQSSVKVISPVTWSVIDRYDNTTSQTWAFTDIRKL